MEPELQRRGNEAQPGATVESPEEPDKSNLPQKEPRDFDWIFVGPHGLRAGWSILTFYMLYYLFRVVVATIFFSAGLIGETIDDSPRSILTTELIPFFSMIAAVGIVALIEGRRILSYSLAGPKRVSHFLSGAAIGFAALSALVGLLDLGGWLLFDHSILSGAAALRYAALWGCSFLVVAAVEEGIFRCFALSTLARGINFWWALAAEIATCVYTFMTARGNGEWGVYLLAILGLFPCLILHRKSAARSAFWQAAWVTSTVFGFYHTQNNGENWIGILAAGSAGFLFCLSVRLTGSVWWALGFHAAWDWAETFFYGTADSGLQGRGHLLSAFPIGNPLWSGGTDGPEGSPLVLGVILVLLLFLFVVYGRGLRSVRAAAAQAPGVQL
jgi:uncharacterized protein